ncbi:hypothetical protein LC55x_0248 [Lysobacter capsici]|uniref:DUF6683 family protein n=1 Tax=Lysobacter capsici TaxID=435897 RepID=UPI00071F468D|nr:hypothetical protein LC55x_0248 [Lysobacter capsici]
MPGLQAVAKGAKPGFAPFAFLRHGFAAVAWFRRVRVGTCDVGRDRRQGLGFALGSITLALSGAVAAQDYQPQMDGFNSTMDSMQSVAGTAAVNAAIKRSLSQRSGAAAPAQRPSAQRSASASKSPAAATGSTADLSFRRDPATTERVRAALIAAMAKQSRGVADDFARRSASAEYRQRFARVLPAQGLANDNLVDVAAYHVAVNWALVHQAPLPSGARLIALRNQLRGSLAQGSTLPELAPQRRQWVADDFLFRALNLSERIDAFARRPEPDTQAQFARAAREDIRRTLGIDLQNYRFTAQGLVQ